MVLAIERSSYLERRAMTIWPRLDRRALGRCGGDVGKITRLVSKRTALPPQSIRALLMGHSEIDGELWFG